MTQDAQLKDIPVKPVEHSPVPRPVLYTALMIIGVPVVLLTEIPPHP